MSKIIELESLIQIPEYIELENKISIEVNDSYEWYGHAYAIEIGKIFDDGEIESNFFSDVENNNTLLFDKLRNDVELVEKHVELVNRETRKLRGASKFFIPYRVKGHCIDIPTVIDRYIDNCSNVRYLVEYEVLLIAEDGYKRYLTLEYETEGSFSISFFEHVKNLDERFERWFNNKENGFGINEYNERTVLFYNDLGEICCVEVDSIDELLRMITSIRVIKCDSQIIK